MAQEQAPPSGPDLTQGVAFDAFVDGKLVGHVGGEEVLLVHSGAELFAVGAHCSHYHAPLADGLRYPARLIDEYAWETDLGDRVISLTGANTTVKVWREPVGVVGAIVPWNFPFEVTINKLAQALATGNTVVLKPAPDTPWNATRLGRLIAERTDIPAGVVNVVTASDHFVGEELTLSPKVDLISFTGSTVVGKRIMEKGASTLKRLFLELGGKSATIVLDDADLGIASFMGMAVCTHAGQGCAIPTRMLLPRPGVDTGMGLERLVSVLQDAPTNYDTDLFRPIIERTIALAGTDEAHYREHTSAYRAVADHTRACAFLIADGMLPGNEGRSYVLRRILRRF